MSRTVTVYYEDDAGEHPLDVTVSREGRHAVIETDLSDIPGDQVSPVTEWATRLFWEAEHADYLRSAQAEMDGA
jgi:hypothetical protein